MNHSKTDSYPVIQKSTDASIFTTLSGNRRINRAHVKRLEEAISEDAKVTLYNPILVNEKFEVIDGQHRLEAIKKLNLPTYYIQVNGLKLNNAQALNKLSKPWSPVDYAKSYSDLGNGNYSVYLALKEEFGLNHDVLMRYVALDNPITGEMFRAGKLIATDFVETQNLCLDLQAIGKFYPRYKNRSFALAFMQVWQNENYDQRRMLMKLEQRPNAIEDRALPLDYIRDLEAIFNHGLSQKVRFA